MNEIIAKDKINIKDMIYEVSGKQVMLDSDLSILYQCKNGTKEINQAVKNNLEKFPDRFAWILDDKESKKLLVKIFDQKRDIDMRGGRYKNPRVFTEQGVAMLATILKSDVATQVSIRSMDAFIAMRNYISSNLMEQQYINNLVIKDNKRIDLLEETLANFKGKNNHLFFKGQIYDAHSLLIDIFNESKKEIIIIDNFIDKTFLDILRETKRKTIIITKQYNNIDYQKYKLQYQNVTLKINTSFHDRFIILGKKILYHCGASFKDLGKKCFEISKIEDEDILNKLLKKISLQKE